MFKEETLLFAEEIQKKEKKKKNKSLSNKMINIIRTTQRNNIDLTAIADNKANVLLSLNAIMITCLVPVVFAYIEIVMEEMLFVPLIVLAVNCFITIYLSAKVLKPSDFDEYKMSLNNEEDSRLSPFFFGNFYKMEAKAYYAYMKQSLKDEEMLKGHLAQDLYYVGKRLGNKMEMIRKAFNLFIFGIFLTLVSTILVLAIV